MIFYISKEMRMIVRFAILNLLLLLTFNAFSEVVVRPYDPQRDYDAVTELCQRYWQELGEMEETCSTSFADEMYTLSSPQMASKADTFAKVVDSDGVTVGFAMYRAPLRQGLVLFDSLVKNFWQLAKYDRQEIALLDEKMAHLYYIAVHPDHQKKGYAKLLLDTIGADLKEKGYITLLSQVEKNNPQAMRWHEKQGFKRHISEAAYSIVEEVSRLTSQSLDRELFHLDFVEREPDAFLRMDLASCIKKLENKLEKTASEKWSLNSLQIAFSRHIANRFSPTISWPPDVIQKIARRYLQALDRQDTYKFAAHLLKLPSLPKKERALVTQILDTMDSNEYKIHSPEDLKKFDFLNDIAF